MRWLLGLLVVAALGGGAWLVLHGSPGTGPSEEETTGAPQGGAAEGRRDGPVLHGTGAAGARELVAAKGRSSIDVDVRLGGRGVVAAVELRRVGGMDLADPFRWGGGWYRAVFALPEPDRAPLFATKSDAQGRARLTGLAPGIYRVAAHDDAGNEGTATTALPQEGARGAVTLDLEPANLVLEARLTWSDGKPLAGTLVLAKTADPRGQSMWLPPQGDAPRAVIQPDGTARVERLRAGTYDVRVHVSEGLALFGPQAVLPAKGTYVFVVDAGQQRLEGRTVDAVAGSPVSGATVLAMCGLDDRRTQLIARAVTDGDGRFTAVVPRVPAQVMVEATGYAPAQRNVAASGTELTVRLSKVARVSGQVTSPDGTPAAGAVVRASTSESKGGGRMNATATADKEGRFALENVSAGDVQVVVKGGGWVSPGLGDVSQGGFNPFVQRLPPGGSATLDLAAVRAGRIEGKVLDAAGATVPGATVTPQAAQRGGFGGGYGEYFSPMSGDQDTVAADDAGAFVLDSLTPGTSYTLNADAPGQARGSAGPFIVESGATAQAELRFPVPRFVDVLLLYEGDEAPVVGARVMAMAQSGTGAWPPRGMQSGSAATDAEGRARTGPVGEGQINVSVTGTMVVTNRQPTPVDGSATGTGPFAVTIRMPRSLTIEGRVVKPDGTPAVGADVELDGERMFSAPDVRTDAEGAFTMTGLAAGSRALRATLRSADRTRITGRATAEAGSRGVTITLGAGDERGKRESFRFRVLDDQGLPVPTANVRLVSGGSSNGTNVIDGVGVLETELSPDSSIGRGLGKGEVFAEASEARGHDGLRLPLGPGRVGPLAVDQREIEIRLPPERAISGRVTTSDGARLAGVLVRASLVGKEEYSRRDGNSSEGRSDAQGAWRIGGLGEGDYQLTVAASPDYVPMPPQTAASGATGVELKLRQGVNARVRVSDHAGKALAGANLSLRASPKPQPAGVPSAPMPPSRGYDPYDRGGSNLSATTALDGTALFRGLDGEATYTLSIGVPAARDDVRALQREGWSPADTDIRMERGYVVAGTVKDAQGKPVEGASLMRKTGQGSWGGERVNPDGTFRIRDLDAGPVTLKVMGPGERRRMNEGGNEVTVQAGAEDVALVVDAGLTLTVRVSNASERREGRLRVTLMQWENERWSQNESERDRDRTGVVVFRGLKTGERYAVWIPPEGDELYAWQPEVRPGEVTVRLERGGTIRGKLTFPAEMRASVSAQSASGLQVSGSVDAEGRYELKGLPDGRWTVSASAYAQPPSTSGTPRPASASNFVHAQGEVQTGGTLDLTLQAPAR